MGAITPVGNDVASTWDSLTHGRGGIGRITRFDPAAYETKIAGEVKDFEPTKYMDRKETRRTDRFSQLAVGAAAQAIEDSKLDVTKSPDRKSVV